MIRSAAAHSLVTKNPIVTTTGFKSQPHSAGTPASAGYTLCPDNGGSSGAGYWTVKTALTLAALRTIQHRRLGGILTI